MFEMFLLSLVGLTKPVNKEEVVFLAKVVTLQVYSVLFSFYRLRRGGDTKPENRISNGCIKNSIDTFAFISASEYAKNVITADNPPFQGQAFQADVYRHR